MTLSVLQNSDGIYETEYTRVENALRSQHLPTHFLKRTGNIFYHSTCCFVNNGTKVGQLFHKFY